MKVDRRIKRRPRRRIQVGYGEKDPCRIAFTEDIHREGLFLKTAQPLRPGTNLCMELLLPEYGDVILQGKVQWARKVPSPLMRVANKGGMGIRILAIDSGSEVFDRYCTFLES